MFNLGALASSVLDSIDSAAKESLEDPKVSATSIRSRRKAGDALSDSELVGSGSAANLQEVAKASLEEQSNHSGHTQESYVVPSPPRSTGSRQESDSISAKEIAVDLSSHASSKTAGAKKVPSDVDELKKALRKKNQEIEKLNRECLEMEEQCSSLREEVQEAWNHFKQAQEKAAFREAELLDEMKQIQKSKATDKQHYTAQINKLNDDIGAFTKQLTLYSQEKLQLSQQISLLEAGQTERQEKIAALDEELQEARMHTMQGAQNLQEELRIAQMSIEGVKGEYTQLLKQHQGRQNELETENSQLNKTIMELERELQRLRYAGPTSLSEGREGEMESMQRELFSLGLSLQKEQEKGTDLERAVRQLEKENKALQILYDDEKKRNSESYNKLLVKNQQLESKLTQSPSRSNNSLQESVLVQKEDDKEVTELKQQVQHLSQLLLRRQTSILELQSERSALKAKLGEVESRCEVAERRLKESEGEDNDFYAVEEGLPSYNSSNRLLNRKKRSLEAAPQAQLISDLEKIGVKPNAGVGRAVTLIDTYAMITGRLLKSNPLFRLGFVIYLLLLHLWALFILVLHTHDLELVDSPQQHIANHN